MTKLTVKIYQKLSGVSSVSGLIKIKKTILAMGIISGSVAMGAAIMSMSLDENSPQWMYSSNQVSEASSKISLGLGILNSLFKDRLINLNLGLGLSALAILIASAYEASLTLAKPALSPMLNAISLIFSIWRSNDPQSYLNKMGVSIFAIGGVGVACKALETSDFYTGLIYTNLSLMFISLGYFAQIFPEMMPSKTSPEIPTKKIAWGIGFSMGASAVLQMVIAGILKKHPNSVGSLLGSSSALFGLGAGLFNLLDWRKLRVVSAQESETLISTPQVSSQSSEAHCWFSYFSSSSQDKASAGKIGDNLEMTGVSGTI